MATPHITHEIASAPNRKAQREAFLVAITHQKMLPLAAAALLRVAPSTGYRWRNGARTTEATPDDGQGAPVKLTARRARRMRLLPRILQVFRASNDTAGAEKVHGILSRNPEIQKEFGPIGHNLVASIMRENGLRGVQNTKKAIKQPDYAANIPHGAFRKPGRKVIGADTTQIQCADREWLYLGIQLDHDDLEIVGSAISEKNDTTMTRRSLREAARTLETKLDDPTVEKIAHSDRGPQYCSAPYKQEIDDQGFVRSNSKDALSDRQSTCGRLVCVDEARIFPHRARADGQGSDRATAAHRCEASPSIYPLVQ
jgi:transposase